jgi:hypothetical protein
MKKTLLLLILAMLLVMQSVQTVEAQGGVWSLTDDQRREFLHHYSPLIMKAANEKTLDHVGHDWITNYYYDNDNEFQNNQYNWIDPKVDFIQNGMHQDWEIRPTLYTAILEFMQSGQKSVILIYHIYHAKDSDHIHDWERFEIRLDGVTGNPGSGESVAYAVVTEHKKHQIVPHSIHSFQQASDAEGKHMVLWQAEWAESATCYKNEVHFVEDTWSTIESRVNSNSVAAVNVRGDCGSGVKGFHYVFVDGADQTAVDFWGAQAITPDNAKQMAWGRVGIPSMGEAKKVTYELQDLADIFPTHWVSWPYIDLSWKDEYEADRPILMESQILSEGMGRVEAPSGFQYFRNNAKDITMDPDFDNKRGIPVKTWFWGAYDFDKSSGSLMGDALAWGGPNGATGTRVDVNGCTDCYGNSYEYDDYFYQHDYYAHDGPTGISGEWLPVGWHTPEQGGFDGRWVQLFDDSYTVYLEEPLTCGDSVMDPGEECDGSDFGNASCGDFGFSGGSLACNSRCMISTGACTVCGDNVTDPGEECDGGDFGDASCGDFGFGGGFLACNSNCTIDSLNCTFVCGDNITDPGEECDGSDFGGLGCVDFGFTEGNLACYINCTMDTIACTVCGDNVTEPGEECDGADLNNQTCGTRGFENGTISCSGCAFNTSLCTASRADTDQNGCIDMGEIGVFMGKWYTDSSDVSMVELVRALEKWKEGC